MKYRYDLTKLAKQQTKRKKGSSVTLPKIQATKASVEAYRKALRAMLREAYKFTNQAVVPTAQAEKQELKVDAEKPWEAALNSLRRILENTLVPIAEATVAQVLRTENFRNGAKWTQNVKRALGVDIGGVIAAGGLQEEVAVMAKRNANLITSLAADVVKRVDQAVTTNIVQGNTKAVLSATLQEQFGVLQSRADLIARDQTTKFNADLNRLRQEQAGLTDYEWVTSEDERVRPTHAANNGKIFSYKKPPAATGNPGDDINCRCVGRAVVTF